MKWIAVDTYSGEMVRSVRFWIGRNRRIAVGFGWLKRYRAETKMFMCGRWDNWQYSGRQWNFHLFRFRFAVLIRERMAAV